MKVLSANLLEGGNPTGQESGEISGQSLKAQQDVDINQYIRLSVNQHRLLQKFGFTENINHHFVGVDCDNVCDGLCDSVCDSVCDCVCDGVCDGVCDSVCDGVCDGLCDKLF